MELEKQNVLLHDRIEELELEIEDMEDRFNPIPNSTIEWNPTATNLNFTDREIMELLEKLYQQHPAQTILSHLEKLANGL